MAVYRDIEDMLTIGAYKTGSNAECDLAIRAEPLIREFLTQGIEQSSSLERTRAGLIELHERIEAMRDRPVTQAFLPEAQNPRVRQEGRFASDTTQGVSNRRQERLRYQGDGGRR